MDLKHQHIGELRSTSLFAGLNDAQMTQVLKNAHVKALKAGEPLFSQGETAAHFFWLHTGLLKLYRLSPAGEEKIIEIIRPGQTFAEAIMFNEKISKYPVNAQMIESGEAWCFSNQDFKDILSISVESCFRLMGKMSQRLHKHINEIDRLTLQTATDRVINYLLQNKAEESDEVQLLISKQTLASQLSIKPETLSRTLRKLTREGLINTDGNIISLLNLDALRAKAEI